MCVYRARIVALVGTALASPLAAQSATPALQSASAEAAATADEEIVVYGRGEVRQVAEVTAEDIRLSVAGASPFIAIQKLPGVNFQSADPFGVYEWSTRITLRGFNQNQLGFTLDGIPLGDMSYGNVNGLHISRAIIADNIASTRVSQGAGALGTASTSNLGGTIEFFSRDPGHDLNIAANGTYGSNDTIRAYVGVDTGDLGTLRANVSYAYLDANKWKGFGTQRSHQVNAKAVVDLGAETALTGFVNFTDRRENDYQDLSLEMIRRLGYDWDNISDQWPLAVRLAYIGANQGYTGVAVPPNSFGTVLPAPFATVDDAYYDAGGLRRDWLGGLKLDTRLADGITAALQGYWHSNKGQGSWFTPYARSPSGFPIAFRTTEYDISRLGILGSLRAERGSNIIQLNAWYEHNDFDQARRFYDVGNNPIAPASGALTYQSNPFFTQWSNAYNTQTFQFALQDQFAISDALILSAGFKGQSVRLKARAIQPNPSPLAVGDIDNEDFFLPQVGILYKLGGGNELFANYTENQRAFTAAATTGPFSTTPAGFAVIGSRLRPETSKTVEGGWRFEAAGLSGVIAAYYVDFSNRLLAIPQGPGIVGNAALLSNVGSVRALGVEAGLAWQLAKPVKLTASYAYNDSTYRNDVVNPAGQVVQAIRGRTTVDAPRHIANLEAVYDDGSFYARANGNYMSRRYFTYSNDQSVGGRILVDAKIGYRFNGLSGPFEGVAVEGSVTNLTGLRYVATIGSNGFGFAGDNQTLLAGAPRQVFVTVRRDF